MSRKILVVDDDKDFLNVAKMFLEGKGNTVSTAENGTEAVITAKKENPDIILLDVIMPGKNGFEVCRELKKNKSTKNIKIVIVSGNIPEIEKGFDYGADDCVVKPLDWNKLDDKIMEMT